MDNNKAAQLLEAAANEIRSLRRTMNVIGARLDAFEAAAHIAGYRPAQQGAEKDLAWDIDCFLIDSAAADDDPDGLAYQRQNSPK